MVNGAANNLIADLHRDPMRKNAALNLLGIFFGFGAIFLPFTMGSLLRALGLAPILWIAAALTLVTTALSAPLAFPPPHRREKSAAGGNPPPGAKPAGAHLRPAAVF